MRGGRRSQRWRIIFFQGKEQFQIMVNVILVLLVVLLIFPLILSRGCSSTPSPVTIDPVKPPPNMIKLNTTDTIIHLYDSSAKQLRAMPLEEYVKGVLSAEMPVSFELEALKAQAVAARTLAFRNLLSNGGPGCTRNKGADVCSSFNHCQAWENNAAQRKKWGSQYAQNIAKITKVVEETSGEVITYQNEPIQVFFHSTSGGMTENVEDVFSNRLPYLRSVVSEGEEGAPHYSDIMRISQNEFIRIFKKTYPMAVLKAGTLNKAIRITAYTGSKRVKSLQVGGINISGTTFRSLYHLESTNFTISLDKTNVVFHTIGYGHGVGMSQFGANSMAKKGSSYEEILEYYYTGIKTVQIRDQLK